jgi:glycosyltransferase involved in cell wall biosynthesis
MHIVWYTHYFTPEIGAPSARIYDLSQNWLRMGHHVQVVTCFPNHPAGKLYPGYNRRYYMYENLNGIDVHRHWTYITPNKGFAKKILGHISYLPSAFCWSNRRLTDPDIVIGSSPTFFAAVAAAGTGVQRKVPFIMEIRDLWPAIFVELGVLKNALLIKLLARFELALYKQATHVVTVTEAFRQNLIARGVPSNKVVTITNGADLEFWQPSVSIIDLRKRLGLEGYFVVLYMGAHGISHALGRILESAERLLEYPDIQFLFVGEGAEKKQLIRQAQELRLENVRFLDPVDREDVREFYAMADVCLVPLRDIPLFETFIPSKMFEIMAMGRPIVGSVRGEAAGILQRSKGSLVVAPEDSNAIAQAILKIYQHPKKAQEMGENGRRFVATNYSRNSLAALYVEVINQVIKEFSGRLR